MATNYEQICEENRRRYGTEGAQKSGGLAASLYDNRAHFIFELLQNAEDALGRRNSWAGTRKVEFILTPSSLMLSHFGQPFDEADVRSVCDIAESTKKESSIGRFGLGFKSVYAITDLPEIHSGEEDFAIEDYVFPVAARQSSLRTDETQILLPLKMDHHTISHEITSGFRQLGPGVLLFLRYIEEISWKVEGGPSGFYLRNIPKQLDTNVQQVSVIGHESGQDEVDQNWLIFHRDVFSAEQLKIGRVEVAFFLEEAKEDGPTRYNVIPLSKSPLVVFFPTVVESYLGFQVQGPFRTTPSRDNIPPADEWNQHLVCETAILLVEAMRWLRDNQMLGVSALRCLPHDREKFPAGSRFEPVFEAVLRAFNEEELLPAFDGRHVTAQEAMLARTQELRELLNPEQIATLFGSEVTAWLSGDITQDKAPEIRQYLMTELDVDEIRPEKFVQSLTKSFLEAQPDEWVLNLYEFLINQAVAVRRQFEKIPLIRLDDGSHVVAFDNGEATAFLPNAVATGFPTVRRAVCATPEARGFLITLGIIEPEPVDDVIRNILPKYRLDSVEVDDDDYEADIERIRAAFNTDSTAQKEKLRSALRDSNFVMVVDSGDGKAYVAKPGDIYIATDRLQQLFAGVPGIFIVDNEYDCLRGEDIRDLLVACGASRYLIPQAISSGLGISERKQIRRDAGLERATWESPPLDFTLRGLTQLLEFLPALTPDEAGARVKVLWEALADLEARGTAAFYGSYTWSYSHETKTARFDATFIRTLKKHAWVPNVDGELVPPGLVVFDTLGWKSNFFLQTKIAFKPPLIDQLAKEANIDPAILDLLRSDPTIVAELQARLSASSFHEPELLTDADSESDPAIDIDVYGDAKDLYGDDMPDIPPGTPDPDAGDDVGNGGGRGGQGRTGTGTPTGSGQGKGGTHGGSDGGPGGHGASGGKGSGSGGGQGKRTPGKAGSRPFISYVGAHPDDDAPDPDGLDHEARMQIEEHAIELIISHEPKLRSTPGGNPGFDLYEADNSGKQIRWIEVKSMTGSLEDRPVGLSHIQFDYAREKGDAYWLYVVEHATDPAKARVLRIKNPVGQSRTFTFDRGWREVALTEPEG